MNFPVNNINDLHTEIARLEALKIAQEIQLKERFKSPGAAFSTVSSLFKSKDHKSSGLFDKDLLSMVSRVVLPFALNKTLFRKSGFIVKTLIALVSQKASGYINEGSIASVVDRFKDFIKPKKRSIKRDAVFTGDVKSRT
jgi:hypothetical protein